MLTNKNKAFGVIEAIIASFVVVVAAASTVALSSGTLRASIQDSNYFEAEHIAEELMEEIYSAKASEQLYFIEGDYGDGVYSIDCFDTAGRSGRNCLAGQPSLYDGVLIGTDGFVSGFPGQSNPSFSDDFFRWFVNVRTPLDCRASDGAGIPQGKCREVDIEVRWGESSGDEDSYILSQYFTDWER